MVRGGSRISGKGVICIKVGQGGGSSEPPEPPSRSTTDSQDELL